MKHALYKLLRPAGKKIIPMLAYLWIVTRRWVGSTKGKPNVIVLSVGSIGNSMIVAREARTRGFQVHVFCHEVPFRETFHLDVWHKLDCRSEFDKALNIARTLNPHAILLAEKNLLLPMQAHLADALGLRSVGKKAAATSNSKIAFREALDTAGVPHLPWCKLDEFTPGKLAFPAVLKPDRGTASKGVRYVGDESALEIDKDYATRMQNDPSVGGELMLEGYVEGRQFDIEGLARDGEYHILTIVEEMYQDTPPYFPPCWFLFNPPIADDLRNRLEARARDALRALGVQNGAWHCEMRVDQNGEVRLLDYANRMGYNQFVSKASGVEFAGSYVSLMCNPDFTFPTPQPMALMRFLSRDQRETAALAKLRRDTPDATVLARFVPFEFSYHQYFAMIGILQPDFKSLFTLMQRYGVVPKIWREFYDLPGDERA